MIWTKKSMVTSSIQILLAATFLFFVVEGAASIAFYHQLRLPGWSVSSAVHLFVANQALEEKFKLEIVATVDSSTTTPKDKLHTILATRDEGKISYPAYLFEPQFHNPSTPYFLTNVAASHIVYCDENGFFNNWTTDELGFRNPAGQVNSSVDYVFLGDSFTVGACEQENGTIAGFFRSKGLTVSNLGREGSGPLFSLATLVEYGALFDSDDLVWIVFTGNDLQNLTEEKVTALGRYMEPKFSQNLYINRVEVQSELREFSGCQVARK